MNNTYPDIEEYEMKINQGQIARFKTEEFLKARFPHKKFSKALIEIIRYLICERQINQLFKAAQGGKNMSFINSCVQSMRLTCKLLGAENLPTQAQNVIFASNHPQGGIEAICIAHQLGNYYGGRIQFYANELLCELEPLKDLFIPIQQHHRQSRKTIEPNKRFFESDNHLITFPAGVTSYKKQGKIIDHPWRKGFVKAAIQHRRDIVPIYFEARNSRLFYFIEEFRKRIHSPINFEVALFAKEFFKQRGKSFVMCIGKPISWQSLNSERSLDQWATFIREKTYELAELNK